MAVQQGATYGIDFYGSATYGPRIVTTLDVSPMVAEPVGYDTLLVSWNLGKAGTEGTDWSHLRLLRNAYGYPTDENDGRVLLDQSVPVGSYLDTGLAPGRFQYYSLFLETTAGYTRAGSAMGLIPTNFAYGDRLFELLPLVYQEMDGQFAESVARYGAGPLQRYLALIGYQLDILRSEYETLLWVNDPQRASGNLLALMTRELGMGSETELGMVLARQQAMNAIHLYKTKGSRTGIEGVVSVLTGWAPNVTIGGNLLLDQDDGSFETSVGRWGEVTNVALSLEPTPGGESVTGSGSQALAMTARGAGDMEARLPGNATLPLLLSTQQYLPRTHAVPLPLAWNTPTSLPLLLGGAPAYSFSAYFRANTTSRNVFLRLLWFNQAGTLISTTDGSQVTELAAPPWWTRASVTATPPDQTAAYVGFALVVVGAAADEIHYVDAAQFEFGAVSTWQPPRQVNIALYADRLNLAENPSFEVDAAGWSVAGTGSLTTTTAQAVSGSHSGQLTVGAGQSALGVRTPGDVPVNPGLTYTLSAYWRPATTARQTYIRLWWYDGAGNSLGAIYGTGPVETAGWVRPELTAIAPAAAARAALETGITESGTTLGNGEVHYVDAVLFEQADGAGDYFDASSGSPAADYSWEGTAHLSRSHYYSRRTTKNYRLTQRLPEFLPAGATFALIYHPAPPEPTGGGTGTTTTFSSGSFGSGRFGG